MKEAALSWHLLRQEAVQTSILSECTPEVIDFLVYNSGGRLTGEAIEYYKIFPKDCIVVTASCGERYIGIACCSIRNGTVKHSILAVNPAYRGRNLGKKLLVRKIEELNEQGLIYESLVACDNEASKKMMSGCGLLSVSSQFYRKRKKGFYKCVAYIQTRTTIEFNIRQLTIDKEEIN